ncbi:hypothetical protein Q2B95_08075 [Stenotrophomonas maltophilia]|uniref:hypothetical protein n=1 Tax=Stenotrophomonas maltophilia TaxID=40324 RepID=UPI0030A2DF77
MSMLDGVSQCWWLSERCTVNWDAWSAVGTVAAVFAAVFAPSIQRRLARRKINALFGMAFQRDIATVKARLMSLSTRFPLDPDRDSAWAVHSAIQFGGTSQPEFLKALDVLQAFAAREVDVSKWGAVDLELAAKVAALTVSLKAFVQGAEVLATTNPDDGWKDYMGVLHAAEQRARRDAELALAAVNGAIASFG